MATYTYRGKTYTNKEDWKAAKSGNKTPGQINSQKSNASGGTYTPSTPNSNKTAAGTDVYSGKTASELDNERKYLNSLISQGGGNAEWAKSQLDVLNSVSPSSTPSSKPSNTSGSFYDPDAELTIDQYLNKYVDNNMMQEIDKVLGQYGVQPQPQEEIDYEEQYRQEQLRAMEEQQEYIREQQRIANQMAVNSGVERLQNQLKTTNKGFDEAGREAYIQATQAEYALPNQLAAMGYTGGLSETEAARSRANYQNRMANIEQQRLNAENEVYAAINELRNTADQRTAEQNAELAREYANRLMELELEGKRYAEQKEAQDFSNWQNIAGNLYYNDYTAEIQRLQADNADGKNDAKIAYLMSLRQQKLNKMEDEEKEQAELDRKSTQQEYENAVALAKLGVFEPLRGLGYDTTNLERQWNADLQKTVKSGNDTQDSKPNQTYQQILNAVQEMAPSGGTDYSENLAASRYILNSDLDMSNVIKLMKQVNVRPEAFVRQMVAEGYPETDVIDFIETYTPQQSYRDSLYKYAYNK